MKNKKKISKILISIIILTGILLLTNKSQALILETVGVVGLGSVLVYVIQLLMLVIGLVLEGIIAGLTGFADAKGTPVTGIKSIIFNENSLTTAGYFATENFPLGLDKGAIWTGNNIMLNLSQNVAKYYYIVRNLSIAILLFVLLYIAIRMAISTVASEEAKYKKMLTNWVVSLATVFVLQYIMIVTFYCNNVLVTALAPFATFELKDYASIAKQGLVPIAGFGEALTFSILVGMEITYLFMYIKRNITLGFLIVIAPLITVTYSIDKIADGKSQALNTWLKEFIFTVLIQPFHCIIYLVLVQSALSGIEADGLKAGVNGMCIIYIIMLTFMKEAEDLIKKIFNIQSNSMPGAAAMGTMALGVMTAMGGFGKGAGKAAGGSGAGAGTSKIPDMDKQGIKNSTFSGGIGRTADTSKGVDIPKVDTKAEKKGLGKGISEIDKAIDTVETNGAKPARKLAKGFNGAKRFFGGKDGLNGAINASIKAGAAVAAFGVGLGMGDAKAAIGLSAIGYSAANKIDGAIDSFKADNRIERNEEIFTDRTKQYVQDYMNDPAHAGATEEDAYKHLKALHDADSISEVDMKTLPAYESDYYQNVYKNMYKSYKQKNSDNADDDVEALIKKIRGI